MNENKTTQTSPEDTRFKGILPQYNIPGFDPNEALTKVQDVDAVTGEVKEFLFMKYQPAMAWFFTIFPEGSLNHAIVTLNDKKAVVTASIYRHKDDVRPAVTATCTRYYSESVDGKFYEQNAVTAAYRKALGYLGFGTPLDAHEVDGIPVENGSFIPERSEAGVPIPRPIVPGEENDVAPSVAAVPQTPDTPAPAVPAAEKKKDSRGTSKSTKAKDKDKAPAPAMPEETAPAPAPVQKAAEKDVAPAPAVKDAPQHEEEAVQTAFEVVMDTVEEATEQPAQAPAETPVEDVPETNDVQNIVQPDAAEDATASAPANKAKPTAGNAPAAAARPVQAVPTTYEEALEIIVPYGSAVGKTVAEAAQEKGKAFIRYHADKAQAGSAFAEACKLFCTYEGC